MKPIANSADSSAIGRGSVIMFLSLASIFGLIALWPFAPPFKSLAREEAQVTKVWTMGVASTTTFLKTSSGHNVKCFHTKTGGCHPETMKSLLVNNAPVIVWHDGERAFQVVANDKVILRYESAFDGRWFAATISIISLLVALIQIAIIRKLISVPHQHQI
jgi:hypothetical protein